MSDTTTALPPFAAEIVRLIRAQDSFGAWERKSDEQLLAGYIVEKGSRPLMSCATPDPDLLNRMDTFYAAVAMVIEKRTGLIASPLWKVNHEGFGRLIFTVGRLVAFSKSLRDVQRFGFASFDKLAEAGEKMIAEAAANIDKYPEAARA
jgi:probable nitrogen fixation protein